ncbi:MAG: M14 family metallocarboxypeptidase [Clostridia bacterium]|nr:M14 family metallocarboxypeptidase [Clostridia bacterium]
METVIQQKELNYAAVTKLMFDLAARYEFIKVYSIGKSVVGRPIYAAEIGIDKDKVVYAGGFHGSERLTTLTLLIFLEQLSAALKSNSDFSISNARDALFGKSLIIVPCVNPDGYEIALNGPKTAGTYAQSVSKILGNNEYKYWNANARGVDINHNFDAGFEQLKELERSEGIVGPSPRRYGGEYPESEPETKAMADLCRNNNVLQLICFHSQGEEIFWSYGENTPDRGYRLARLFATASGYRLVTPQGTASYGGYKDWFIKAFNRPGFTIELGKGENPLNPNQLYDIYNKVEELLLLGFAL